jgi:alpha-aminoadipic semialdehyde synthase
MIGIRREDKNKWERRTPLTPEQLREIKQTHHIGTIIQPSDIRIFSDEKYRDAGIFVQEDLSACSVIFGVKEMPVSFFQPEKTYVFFSHTIKGQKFNIPMLKKMMDLKCTLIDYEKVEDDQNRRLLFFGRYAGLAGMMDTLWALGKRLEWEGISNPFSSLNQTHAYHTLKEVKEAVSRTGEQIKKKGLPQGLNPLICGFAGYGHVSQGAQEIFDLLPCKKIRPEDLQTVFTNKSDNRTVYKVVFKEKHLVTPKASRDSFDLQDYYDYPDKYVSVFESNLPYLTLMVNAIYWTPCYPRLITLEGIRKLFEKDASPRLRIIGDITCDVKGAVECTLKATQPDNPVFVYNPDHGKVIDGVKGKGVVVMAVDNLPCELPRASSIHFGSTLMPFVPEIVKTDFSQSFTKCTLPPTIRKGTILYRGHFTSPFRYMESFFRT